VVAPIQGYEGVLGSDGASIAGPVKTAADGGEVSGDGVVDEQHLALESRHIDAAALGHDGVVQSGVADDGDIAGVGDPVALQLEAAAVVGGGVTGEGAGVERQVAAADEQAAAAAAEGGVCP